MSDDRAYRIMVQYLPEEERFVARSPELDVEATAESRAEAITAVETALEEAFEKAAVDEVKLPRPADLATETGTLSLELAAPVWRDLQMHATAQGLEPDALALQLLASALGRLEGRGRRGARNKDAKAAPPKDAEAGEEQAQPSNRPEKKEGGKRGRGRGRGRREGYRPDMDDQANFLAYVRDQERGGRGRR